MGRMNGERGMGRVADRGSRGGWEIGGFWWFLGGRSSHFPVPNLELRRGGDGDAWVWGGANRVFGAPEGIGGFDFAILVVSDGRLFLVISGDIWGHSGMLRRDVRERTRARG